MQSLQDNPREGVQLEALKSWVENKKIGSIILAPGFGKSRLGVIAAGEQLRKGSIRKALVVVPTVALVEQ